MFVRALNAICIVLHSLELLSFHEVCSIWKFRRSFPTSMSSPCYTLWPMSSSVRDPFAARQMVSSILQYSCRAGWSNRAVIVPRMLSVQKFTEYQSKILLSIYGSACSSTINSYWRTTKPWNCILSSLNVAAWAQKSKVLPILHDLGFAEEANRLTEPL